MFLWESLFRSRGSRVGHEEMVLFRVGRAKAQPEPFIPRPSKI
jgi:hypothetical protein